MILSKKIICDWIQFYLFFLAYLYPLDLNRKGENILNNNENAAMTSLSVVINNLTANGYTGNFIVDNDGFMNKSSGERFHPEDLTIVKVYRFEGQSDPADMSVVFAIETRNGTKGLFIDAFGTYADYDNHKAADYFKTVKILKDH